MNEHSALIPVEERTISFYDDQIRLVIVEKGNQQQAYVPIRPICEFLDVAWSPQLRRINRDPILSEVISSVTVTVTESGQRGQMLCLPLDYLNGFLFGINANRVRPEIRDRLLRYQRECYQVLAQAYGGAAAADTPADASSAMTALVQVREMGLALVRLAEEQMEFERRLVTTESRLERAALVFGDLTRRVAALEEKAAPAAAVSEDQASQISQAVKAVALALGKQTGRNEFGAVYGELYRKFGITSYKQLPRGRFDEAMRFLTEWYQTITGEGLPF